MLDANLLLDKNFSVFLQNVQNPIGLTGFGAPLPFPLAPSNGYLPFSLGGGNRLKVPLFAHWRVARR